LHPYNRKKQISFQRGRTRRGKEGVKYRDSATYPPESCAPCGRCRICDQDSAAFQRSRTKRDHHRSNGRRALLFAAKNGAYIQDPWWRKVWPGRWPEQVEDLAGRWIGE